MRVQYEQRDVDEPERQRVRNSTDNDLALPCQASGGSYSQTCMFPIGQRIVARRVRLQ
jgi:hypothetical protein